MWEETRVALGITNPEKGLRLYDHIAEINGKILPENVLR